jgi:lipopolysaccharide transport system ATP-binding protein
MSSDIAIKVENLSKCYHIYDKPRDRLTQMFFWGRKQFYREFWALKDVSFEIKKGETVGIIGRNGCGKSTLLQMISGTLNPTCGKIETHGRIAALLELGSGFNPEFTGRENVYMNAAVLGLSHSEIDTRYDEILNFAAIGDFINQPVKTYSSGMIVRLAFAVSVCVEPDILIVDEALAVGDAAFAFKCLDRLRKLTASGTTLLFVSHDMGMVKNFCNHVVYLVQGAVKSSGAPDEMAEYYLLDMRDEQRRAAGNQGGVTSKPFLGIGQGIAFGTEEGHILAAAFTNTGTAFSSYVQGEEIVIRIKVKSRPSVKSPSLSVIVQDRRMMDIGGAFFPIAKTGDVDGWFNSEISVSIPASFARGRYSITLRFEDREDDYTFQPIDKQVGILVFEVLSDKQSFLGSVPLNICARAGLRIVALLAVRNEGLYLARCLEHLYLQGIETCVIDNQSTDDTVEIARSFMGRGVFQIETRPFNGYYDWTDLLSTKQKLASEIVADWFMHYDADEIREAPAPYRTLKEGIEAADLAGYNAINFDEFVFLPTSDTEAYEGTDYVEAMRYYYFFEPSKMRQIKAWKKTSKISGLVESGGHGVDFEGRRIFPVNFIMRHYIALSAAHVVSKYTKERIYARQEIDDRGWHGPRATFTPDKLKLPERQLLKCVDSGIWDTSQPWKAHTFLEGSKADATRE